MTSDERDGTPAVSGAVELEAELRACPFCGGSASMVRGGPGNFFVQCEECRSAGDDGSEERALAAWNRRADDAELATLRSDNERLGRERDADIDALHGTFSKPIAVLQERVAAAEAERDTLLAQVAKMRGALEPFAAAAEHFDCHVKDGDLFPRPPADRP